MNAAIARILLWLDRRIVKRRDSTSTLLFSQVTIATLLLPLGFQLQALSDPAARRLFDADWLMPSIWAQCALIAWLLGMGVIAWHRRHDKRDLPWLMHMAVLPGLVGVTLVCHAYGVKDTPMAIVSLAEVALARALFPLRKLAWAYGLTGAIVIAAEIGEAQGWLLYAPLLANPVFMGVDIDAWWMTWLTVVFFVASVTFAGWLFLLADIWTRHRQELETLGRTDLLTGLANRRELMARLQQESHRQQRDGHPLSVVMLDVDHFKHVNDTWGHPAGDEVLARLGRILRTKSREHIDVAGRYGGEEFVLVLPDTDLKGAERVAESISRQLKAERFHANGQVFSVTQSVGVAQVLAGDVEAALKVADQNLYLAKKAGRDRIVVSPDSVQVRQSTGRMASNGPPASMEALHGHQARQGSPQA